MRKIAGLLLLLVGLLLLIFLVQGYSELTEIASSATSPDPDVLSLPTRVLLEFGSGFDIESPGAKRPADFAAMLNKITIGFGITGFVLLVTGIYLMLTGFKDGSEKPVS